MGVNLCPCREVGASFAIIIITLVPIMSLLVVASRVTFQRLHKDLSANKFFFFFER